MRENVVEYNAEMSAFTTIGAGDIADCVFSPRSEQELIKALSLANTKSQLSAYLATLIRANNSKLTHQPATQASTKSPHSTMVMGAGSKLLFVGGYHGTIIRISNPLSPLQARNNILEVSAGERLARVARHALNLELSGLEWSIGIPACIGGAIYMNAGAYGGDMSSVVDEVEIYHNGERKWVQNDQCAFGYRTSIFHHINATILRARLRLKKGKKPDICALMAEYFSKRVKSQPRGVKSLGSAFKRLTERSSGEVIESCGLKGCKIGDALVSFEHANFIVNNGHASASDILKLIEYIEHEVKQKTGIKLEREIIVVGKP